MFCVGPHGLPDQPTHAARYSGHGFIAGSPVFQDSTKPPAAHELAGTLDWKKLAPSDSQDRGYGAFAATLTLLGRDYHAPAPGTIFLGLPDAANNAHIAFAEAGLAASAQGAQASQTFRLSTKAAALFANDATNPCRVSLRIDAASGRFTGGFQLDDTGVIRRVDCEGIFVTGETDALGFFTLLPIGAGNILSGSVKLAAPVP